MDRYQDCGVIYAATGERFVDEARVSARSVNERWPDLPVVLFTDLDCYPPEFDEVKQISDPNFGFADKIETMLKSPFDRTLFLDCDTYVVDRSGLSDLFDILTEFDVAASHAAVRRDQVEGSLAEAYDHGVPNTFPLFNGGLLAFRSSPMTTSFLKDWLGQYCQHLSIDDSASDQEALRISLYRSDCRVATIPSEYNFRIPYPQLVYDEVKILHGRAANREEIAATLNERWDPETGRRYIPVHIGPGGLTGDYEPVVPLVDPSRYKVVMKRLQLSVAEFGIARALLHLLFGGPKTGRLRFELFIESLSQQGLIGTCKRALRWLQTGQFED